MTTKELIENIMELMDYFCTSQCIFRPDECMRKDVEEMVAKLVDKTKVVRYAWDSVIIKEFFEQNPLSPEQKQSLKDALNKKYGGYYNEKK